MRFVLLGSFLLLFITLAPAQQKPPVPESAEYYLNLLSSSKDSLYRQVLATYEAYLARNPNDFKVRMDQCEVIQKAFYDDYDDYNPQQEQFDACLTSLVTQFPNQLEVILYNAEQQWGDSTTNLMLMAQRLKAQDVLEGDMDLYWKVHQQLATQNSYNEEHYGVIARAESAMELNDTLDMSRLVAESYVATDEPQKAIDILLKYKDFEANGWELAEKGKILLHLEEPEAAMDFYERALADTANSWFDKTFLAKALVENGRPDEAREFFANAAENEYSGIEARLALFKYDLEYSPADSIAQSYRNLVEESFMHDPMGKFRWQMLWKAPSASWTFDDVLRALCFWLVLGLCLLAPYLWVLPVFALGVRLKNKGRLYEPLPDPMDQRWRLKQFWLLSSFSLLAEILTTYFLGYESWVLDYNEVFSLEETTASQAELANSGLLYFGLSMVATFIFLRLSDIRNFWGKQWGIGKSIGFALLAAFCLRMFAGIITVVQTILSGPSQLELMLDDMGAINQYMLSVVETIGAINTEYSPLLGFLIVVILVPIYEEYMFRGVFLSAMQRHIGFFWSNVIQTTMFALVHDDLSLFLFYLAFGITAGYLRKNSGSISASIIMHMLNNLVAFIAILLL